MVMREWVDFFMMDETVTVDLVAYFARDRIEGRHFDGEGIGVDVELLLFAR